ncbi:MAG: hypothetical protein QM598_12320 [Protaetiibacter sp.]
MGGTALLHVSTDTATDFVSYAVILLATAIAVTVVALMLAAGGVLRRRRVDRR